MKVTYNVVFSKSAAKEIRSFPREIIGHIIHASEKLSVNPRPSGCKKLKGNKEEIWRIRVGEYRIVYIVEDSVHIVEIRKVRHRKDVYRL
jgi:mRNA interferase RelE/StbE